MHGDCTVHLRVVPIRAGDRVNIAVERQSDDATLSVEQRAAGVSADDVVGGYEVERRAHVEPLMRIEPDLRQPEGRLAGRSLVEPLKIRERLDLLALLGPAPYRAMAHAQGERGVRVGVPAAHGEAGGRDL